MVVSLLLQESGWEMRGRGGGCPLFFDLSSKLHACDFHLQSLAGESDNLIQN